MVLPGAIAALAAGKAFDEGNDALEIKKKKSEDGAGLDDDGVHLPICIVEWNAHRGFGEAKVRGRTNRKKFG
jgi:hypothetical protein